MNWFLPKTSSQTCCSRMHTCSISVARCLWVSSGRRKRCHAPSGSSSSLADEDRPPPPRPRLRFLFFLGLDLGLGGGRVESHLEDVRTFDPKAFVWGSIWKEFQRKKSGKDADDSGLTNSQMWAIWGETASIHSTAMAGMTKQDKSGRVSFSFAACCGVLVT